MRLAPRNHPFTLTTLLLIMASLSKNITSAYRVAIIGGGISGCAAARRLAQLNPSTEITLYEIGRGPGGRASTRRTRSMPNVRINHGSPYAELVSPAGREVVSSLPTGSVMDFVGREGCVHAGLSHNDNGEWELHDKPNEKVGVADWSVVSGSGVAHPRWTKTFGGEPPLIEASKKLQDPSLSKSLDGIAKLGTLPVLAVFFVISGESSLAKEWLSLGYAVIKVENDPVVSKIIVQKVEGSSSSTDEQEPMCSVLIHSTEEFAVQNEGVYGATSSAAQVGDASSNASRKEEFIETMLASLRNIPGVPKPGSSSSGSTTGASLYQYGPFLHRWGNAFLTGEPLSAELSFVPGSRVGFCGDYVEPLVENV